MPEHSPTILPAVQRAIEQCNLAVSAVQTDPGHAVELFPGAIALVSQIKLSNTPGSLPYTNRTDFYDTACEMEFRFSQALFGLGRHAEGVDALHRAIAWGRKSKDLTPDKLAFTYRTLAHKLIEENSFDDAVQAYREAINVTRAQDNYPPEPVCIDLCSIATAYWQTGQVSLCSETKNELCTEIDRCPNDKRPKLLGTLIIQAQLLLTSEQIAFADKLIGKLKTIKQELREKADFATEALAEVDAVCLFHRGKPDEGIAVHLEALNQMEQRLGSANPQTMLFRADFADYCLICGKAAVAERHLMVNLAILEEGQPELPINSLAATRLALAEVCRQSSKFSEANHHLIEARRVLPETDSVIQSRFFLEKARYTRQSSHVGTISALSEQIELFLDQATQAVSQITEPTTRIQLMKDIAREKAMLYIDAKQLDRASEAWDELSLLVSTSGVPSEQHSSIILQAMLADKAGEPHKIYPLLLRKLAELSPDSSPHIRVLYLYHIAEAELDAGDTQTAIERLESARNILLNEVETSLSTNMAVLISLAHAYGVIGATDKAEECARAVHALEMQLDILNDGQFSATDNPPEE